MVDRQKAKAISDKQLRDKRRQNSLIEDDRYYNSETSANLD